MSDPEHNHGDEAVASDSTDDLGYEGIIESSVEDLFHRFRKMSPQNRINEVSSICLAKSLSKHSGLENEDTKLEYLKEYGRNERAVLKSDGGGGNDDDDGMFQR